MEIYFLGVAAMLAVLNVTDQNYHYSPLEWIIYPFLSWLGVVSFLTSKH